MSISRKLMTVGGGDPSYVEDVFSTYLYEGTGANQDIVNGIDLDDKGGMVWAKRRDGTTNHAVVDTERGAEYPIFPNLTTRGDYVKDQFESFNSDGFTVGVHSDTNSSGGDYASWTFAKQRGFFDVVTYTGDLVAGREIPHNLGSVPGMIIVKSTTRADAWAVYHRSLGNQYELRLNEEFPKDDDIKYWNYTDPTDTVFTVGTDYQINGIGEEYVAYLFAHDAQEFGPDGDESIIKCGLSGENSAVDLGWEPQWVLVKSSNQAQDWFVIDSMRGYGGVGAGAATTVLEPNTTSPEGSAPEYGTLTPTGFTLGNYGSGTSLIYMAIRRPHKPAEEFESDELFAQFHSDNPASLGGLPGFRSGFPVDMALWTIPSVQSKNYLGARLTGTSYLTTDSQDASDYSSSAQDFTWDYMDGWYEDGNAQWYSWMWRRAPGFFDVVTYTGNAQNPTAIPHGLGVTPEMFWVKPTNSATEWFVNSTEMDATHSLKLNEWDARGGGSIWGTGGVRPTETHFTVGDAWANGSGKNYIAFLFASVPGISKIGSYTGTGGSIDVDCGFTNGARFVLIKRVDSLGGWHYWDTLRGIVSGNSDPYLLMDTEAAQVTTNYIDPLSSGFTVTALAPAALNSATSPVSSGGGKYLYMAIA